MKKKLLLPLFALLVLFSCKPDEIEPEIEEETPQKTGSVIDLIVDTPTKAIGTPIVDGTPMSSTTNICFVFTDETDTIRYTYQVGGSTLLLNPDGHQQFRFSYLPPDIDKVYVFTDAIDQIGDIATTFPLDSIIRLSKIYANILTDTVNRFSHPLLFGCSEVHSNEDHFSCVLQATVCLKPFISRFQIGIENSDDENKLIGIYLSNVYSSFPLPGFEQRVDGDTLGYQFFPFDLTRTVYEEDDTCYMESNRGIIWDEWPAGVDYDEWGDRRIIYNILVTCEMMGLDSLEYGSLCQSPGCFQYYCCNETHYPDPQLTTQQVPYIILKIQSETEGIIYKFINSFSYVTPSANNFVWERGMIYNFDLDISGTALGRMPNVKIQKTITLNTPFRM